MPQGALDISIGHLPLDLAAKRQTLDVSSRQGALETATTSLGSPSRRMLPVLQSLRRVPVRLAGLGQSLLLVLTRRSLTGSTGLRRELRGVELQGTALPTDGLRPRFEERLIKHLVDEVQKDLLLPIRAHEPLSWSAKILGMPRFNRFQAAS